ncbi:MAG: TrkA family potassium uptake protein [Actinomycetaceae bacterium]|nr:TrkA family potassium uptake protein [Actinomycetaceae bacterium]
MKVLIAGAGSVGCSIARELANSGQEITIIDKEPSAMKVASIPDADWILADACEVSSLVRSQAGQADVVIAATGDDKSNLVISLLSKTEFGVERVIARVNDPKNEWLFDDAWGVDVAVSTPRVMAPYVEDAVANGRLVTVMRFFQSGASLMQTTLPADAPLVGMVVSEVVLPPTIVLNAIVRDGVPFTADPDLTIEAGDQVLFICADGSDVDLDLVRQLVGDERFLAT